MEITWGDGLGEETKGLDILGIRALDQSLEVALANGITTISLRGRYFTILPWLIGEFFEADRKAGASDFDENKLKSFIGRVEYLTLACTVTDDSGGDAGGALGLRLFREAMAKLRSGKTIPYPKDRKGSMLGTYFGPCRALGVVKTSDRAAPQLFSLTPRGQEIWAARGKAINGAPIRQLIQESDSLTPEDVKAAQPHFSLMRLTQADEEAACLREALQSPWEPVGGGDAVALAYERFTATLAWLRAEAESRPLRAASLLTDNYRQIIGAGRGDGTVRVLSH